MTSRFNVHAPVFVPSSPAKPVPAAPETDRNTSEGALRAAMVQPSQPRSARRPLPPSSLSLQSAPSQSGQPRPNPQPPPALSSSSSKIEADGTKRFSFGSHEPGANSTKTTAAPVRILRRGEVPPDPAPLPPTKPATVVFPPFKLEEWPQLPGSPKTLTSSLTSATISSTRIIAAAPTSSTIPWRSAAIAGKRMIPSTSTQSNVKRTAPPALPASNPRAKTKKADITMAWFIETQMERLSVSSTPHKVINPQVQAALAVSSKSMTSRACTTSHLGGGGSRVIERHRGKKREMPRKHHVSKLKRHILMDRDIKKKRADMFSHRSIKAPLSESALFPFRVFLPPQPVVERQDSDLYRTISGPVRLVLERSPRLLIDRSVVREYCAQLISKELENLVTKLLSNLMRFQQRMKAQNPTKAKQRRRLLVGLREVLRQTQLGKLKAIIVAKNIEASLCEGSLDDKLNEIVEAARLTTTPIIFALSRRNLGSTLGQKVPVSIVGVERADGAESELIQVLELGISLRQQWTDEFCRCPNDANHQGELPVHVAAAYGHLTCLEKLLQLRWGDVDTPTLSAIAVTPLMLAAQHGRLATVQFLLKCGADPAKEDHAGLTALEHAYIYRRERIVSVLKPISPVRDLRLLKQMDVIVGSANDADEANNDLTADAVFPPKSDGNGSGDTYTPNGSLDDDGSDAQL